MIQQRVLVGSVIIVLCLMLFASERWFLGNTAKGQQLIRWFGSAAAPWVLRGLTIFGLLFGGLLATGVIRPIQW